MRIEKVTIKNFRCFEELTVNLHRRVTLFVGSNGSGKSSLLEAIKIAAGVFLYGIDDVPGSSIKKTDAKNVCYEIGSVLDLQPQFPVELESYGIIDGKKIKWKVALNSSKGKITTGEAKEIISFAKEKQSSVRNGDTSAVLPLISYYGTGRLWAQKKEKQNEILKQFNRFNGYVDCLDSESNEKLMRHWFQKMTLQEAQLGKTIPEFAAVKKAVSKCYSNITNNKDAKAIFNLDTHEIDIVYADENGKKQRLPMSDLSDGYKNTISMISDISYRMALLNPQLLDDVLQTPGIVIIDEIDLHLHPVWQQRIIGDLCDIFPNVQFIFSTHAPSVINSIDKENLVILKDNKVLVPQNQTFGRDSNSILREVMYANERPKDVQQKFDNFYSVLDSGNYQKAEELLDELKHIVGENEHEVASCQIALELNQI